MKRAIQVISVLVVIVITILMIVALSENWDARDTGWNIVGVIAAFGVEIGVSGMVALTFIFDDDD